ncbi:MAG: DNA ligase D [Chitinophagaceae bacterium]|nr:DNA ligase D [Chitinophagaceae bacterium]
MASSTVKKTADGRKDRSSPAKKRKRAVEKTATAPPGRRSKQPVNLQPMLATLVDQPFDEPGWVYEVKWDGYRALAYLQGNKVTIASRNNKSFDEKFYPVHAALKQLNVQAVVDGEIVVTDRNGLADFSGLQGWRSEADGDLKYYLFDILWLDGRSLLDLPLTKRRAILRKTIRPNQTILLSENFDATGTEFFHIAEKMGLEGIIAKKADSVYTPGLRSKEWLKIKTAKRQEMVIGGFTRNEGSSKLFSSLLVGVRRGGKLVYTGKIGTGFTVSMQQQMMKQFEPLITGRSPFESIPDINKPSRFRPDPPKAEATWLKPKLVCEVSYRELTTEGIMRHPSFEGMRDDKQAKQVVLEEEKPVTEVVQRSSALHRKKIISASSKKERKTLLNPTDETQVRSINGHELKFTNLSKLYWPKEKITKRDMLNYYYQVAPFMLPYMKDRPQSLNRHPNGINGESFYQKDVKGKAPGWIATFPYRSEAEARDKEFMVCTDESSLLYIASLGCIEMNPWSSTVQTPDHPDWCIIDLDPDKHGFDKVIEAAQVTKQILDAAGVQACCKTSGSTGIHIYIPLGRKYTYEQSKEFGRVIAKLVHQRLPRFTSIERIKANRKGGLYIDFLQNRPQATLATAYSLRPKPGATVSMPLHWEELKKGLRMTDFNIHNAVERLKSEGDLFKPVLGKGIDMTKALKKLNAL